MNVRLRKPKMDHYFLQVDGQVHIGKAIAVLPGIVVVLGRMHTSCDIAGAVLLLFCKAARWSSGQNIYASGGMEI